MRLLQLNSYYVLSILDREEEEGGFSPTMPGDELEFSFSSGIRVYKYADNLAFCHVLSRMRISSFSLSKPKSFLFVY